MARTAGRSREDTRTLLLDAAATEVLKRGVMASLDEIAATAGISKGGILYHFTNKETLLTELAQSRMEKFRSQVMEYVDPADQNAGSFTRGYIRAVLAPDQDPNAVWEEIQLLTHLMLDPDIDALIEDFGAWLTTKFNNDGLPRDVSAFIVSAADGASYSMLWGGPANTQQRQLLERRLLALTCHPEWLASLPWDQEEVS